MWREIMPALGPGDQAEGYTFSKLRDHRSITIHCISSKIALLGSHFGSAFIISP